MNDDHARGNEKDYQIVVNGVPRTVSEPQVSYEQVTQLAFPVPPVPDTLYSVTFRKAKGEKEGSLAPGASVEIKHQGTVFNVTPTGKS